MLFYKLPIDNYCAIIGNCDPPLKEHEALFKRLREYCNKNNLVPLVILITPNPSVFYAEKYYRDYFDFETRVEWLKKIGIFDIIKMTFEEKDLKAGAAEFFNQLYECITIEELWLGGMQSFGSQEAGSQDIIINECLKRSIKVTSLEKTLIIKQQRANVYNQFASANFKGTYFATGYYPTVNIVNEAKKNIFDGTYLVKNVTHPFNDSESELLMIEFSNGILVSDNKLKEPWIQFIEKTSNQL